MNDIDYNKDYYSTLGVSKDASADEIKSAFRKLSMKYHPDRQQGKTEQEKKESTEKFQEINDAYEVVGNKDKRAEYDQIREMGGRRMGGMGGMGGFGFGQGDDLMREFMRRNGFGDMSGFGHHGGFSNEHFRKAHRQRNPIDGQDIHINVNLSFEDFFFGCTKTLDIKVKNKCSHCKNGLTGDTPEYTTCPSCRGTGMRTTRQGNMIMQETCQNCGGTGEILKNRCTHCNGTTEDGIRVQSCVLEIPKFSYSGFTKSFGKVGHCGRFGGSAGDITVTAYMNDNGRFVLNSDYDCETLRTVHFVPVLKALIGGKEKILTPYGYVEVDIPRCMENPTEITVPKKGLKRKNSNENADLIVVLQWDMPKSVNDKEKELIQKVLKSMGGRDGTFESVEKLNEFDKEYVKRINETFTSNIS